MENSTKKGMALWKKILIGFVVLVVISSTAERFIEKSDAVIEKHPQKNLTMAYVKSRRVLKENLKDPDSYQEIDHKEYYVSGPDSAKNDMQVLINYRSKNSFGGYVVSKRAFTLDSTGNITDTYEPSK